MSAGNIFCADGRLTSPDARWREYYNNANSQFMEMSLESLTAQILSAYRLFFLLSGKFHNGFSLAMNVQFFIDALDVSAHGAQADAEFASNFFVGMPAR